VRGDFREHARAVRARHPISDPAGIAEALGLYTREEVDRIAAERARKRAEAARA